MVASAPSGPSRGGEAIDEPDSIQVRASRRRAVCTGSIGLLGTKPSWEMMQGADTLLMVGSSFPYSEFLPKEGQVKAVQIYLLGRMLSIR